MASLIPGFEYDVFISYRQKDNKYDGWVTEFVDNLNRELESVFKEEVTVYFDFNPQDGLLETHDVAASLEEKLKCLVFIPILSRTYCDPKSYAWENEFKAFVEHASKDQFGMKVNLLSGNVANRVLPVRINDLSASDIKLCESIFGGVIRGVDFIYKSAGVNRPLRSKEENPHDNLNHTIYRDQINKVSLAVMDIIESMKVSEAFGHGNDRETQVKQSVKTKVTLTDEPVKEELLKSEQEATTSKIKLEEERKLPLLWKPRLLVPGVLIIIAVFSTLILILVHRSKVRWVKDKAIPEINQLVDKGQFINAFNLAKKAEKYTPGDSELEKLWPNFSNCVTILSYPPGAKVYQRDYNASDTNWLYIGKTPVDSIRYPFNFSRIKVVKDGYQTVYDATNSLLLSLRNYLLDSIGHIPENMVHIPSIKISVDYPDIESAEIRDFLIDKYEVTNKDYKNFIDSGGYRNEKYWKQPFIKDGKTISWEMAKSIFIDKTGRNGPSTWEAGDYPKGEDNYPVSGVSWYEAAAYAEFARKSLPTYYHWRRTAGFDIREYLPTVIFRGLDGLWGPSFITLKSNLSEQGPAPVGSYQGMSGYGTYDMIGNVREWCWNEASPSEQRFILGAGWKDPAYISVEAYTQAPFDRSEINGFRCASYFYEDENLRILKRPITQTVARDFKNERPATDQQFEIFKRMYAYEKSALNAVIVSEDKSESSWIKQKVSFDAAYGNEHVTAYLFLPKAYYPPYQIVVYFPGASARNMLSSESLIGMGNIDFLVKNGRAVLYPVFKGTYERRFEESPSSQSDIAYREHVILWYKDLARSIDYLETRSDIDISKLSYFGFSWGGYLGPLMAALDDRIKVSILYVAGLSFQKHYPEVDPFNYVHRVSTPTLLLNGKYDSDVPYETSQIPLYELLGTSSENKRQIIYESGHFVPRSELIKESLNWLDKYLGPVNK